MRDIVEDNMFTAFELYGGHSLDCLCASFDFLAFVSSFLIYYYLYFLLLIFILICLELTRQLSLNYLVARLRLGLTPKFSYDFVHACQTS